MITVIIGILKFLGVAEKYKTLVAYGLLFAAIAAGLGYVRHTGVIAERNRQEAIIAASEVEAMRVKLDTERRNAAIKTAALEAASVSSELRAADVLRWQQVADDLNAQLAAMKIEEDKPDVQNPNIIIRTRNVCVVPDGYRERLLSISPRKRGGAKPR